MLKWIGLFAAGLLCQSVCVSPAHATYCEGASQLACYKGIDHSGRSFDAMYASAQEALKYARTPVERALAQEAMVDAHNPKMSDPIAQLCNAPKEHGTDWKECLRTHGEEDDFNPFGVHVGDRLSSFHIVGNVPGHPELAQILPPNANPLFKIYYIETTPETGACVVMGKTGPISGMQNGADTLASFHHVSDILSAKYGVPQNTGSGDRFSYATWNVNLFSTGRSISDIWSGSELGGPLSHIREIRLDLRALSGSSTNQTIVYVFDNIESCMNAQHNHDNKGL